MDKDNRIVNEAVVAIEKDMKEIKRLSLAISEKIEQIITSKLREALDIPLVVKVKTTMEQFVDKGNTVDKSKSMQRGTFSIRTTIEDNKFKVTDPTCEWVRSRILDAGNKIGSVWFYKRTNGELRKMSYRLHVTNPSVVKKPSGKAATENYNSDTALWEKAVNINTRKNTDIYNDQMTVYDTNKVVRDRDGVIIGRGSYRTIPLDQVIRIVSNGKTYEIERQNIAKCDCVDCSR